MYLSTWGNLVHHCNTLEQNKKLHMKNFLLNHKKRTVFWLLIFKYSADIQESRDTTFIYSFIKLDTCYVQGTILEAGQKSCKQNSPCSTEAYIPVGEMNKVYVR